jgi:transcription-repair coupling factor (superfamily II helicase)
VQKLPTGALGVAVWPLEHGFVLDGLEVIGEEDILGDRLSRPQRKRRPSERFIAEAAALSEGDLVVHREHGVGRYEGLVTLEIQIARHDCLRLTYEGGDKLFVPVENIDVLSRYGSAEEGAALDRLGGVAWQSRKARLKQRIADMADRLIKIAAERAIRRGETMSPPEGAYEEFCARFPMPRPTISSGDLRRAGRPVFRQADGPAGVRRRRLRQDRGGVARGLRGGIVGQAGRGDRPDDAAGAPASPHLRRALPGPAVAIGRLSRLVPAKEAKETKAAQGGHGRHRDRHPCAAGQEHRVQGPRPADRRRGAAFRRRHKER